MTCPICDRGEQCAYHAYKRRADRFWEGVEIIEAETDRPLRRLREKEYAWISPTS